MPFLFPLLPYVTAYLNSLKANFKNIKSISETKLTKMAFNDPRMHNTSYAKQWHTLLDSILSALRSKSNNREGWAFLKVFVYIKKKEKYRSFLRLKTKPFTYRSYGKQKYLMVAMEIQHHQKDISRTYVNCNLICLDIS